MNFEEGDLVECVIGFFNKTKGVVVRTDGGQAPDLAGTKDRCIFVWYTGGNYDWHNPVDLIKINKLNVPELKSLLIYMNKYLNKKLLGGFDNLRYMMLYNRYRELQREFQAY